MEVRLAEPSDFAHIAAIEAAGDAGFAEIGYAPLPQGDGPSDHSDATALLVAGRPPVGFAAVVVVDELAHLEQVSVLPEVSRRGIGSLLIESACRWAVKAGYRAITLTTYSDVPWNAPFYARLGFREVAPTAGLEARRLEEGALGLDALGPRVVMRRELGDVGDRSHA